jgi:C4-dicarboxylate transporter
MSEKILQFNNEKNLFWTLSFIIGLCGIFYIYCIISIIHNVVARQESANQVANLLTDIGSKEFDFINLKNNITLSYAESHGFAEVKEKTFINNTSVSLASNSIIGY